MEVLYNEELTLQINPLGAELCSIKNNFTDEEYIWQADPIFWKRHAPILFPIVGSVWNGKYKHKGIIYKMKQHGFARDREFTLFHSQPNEICFILESDPQTLAIYPFPFLLEITYKLEGKKITVLWKVKNTGDSEMYFQIGAHPAFMYKDNKHEKNCKGYFNFNVIHNLKYLLIKEKGCVQDDYHSLHLENGLLPITSTLFDHDALIFENNQVSRIDLLSPNKEPYIRLHFDAPLVGLWSPSANAPFVCIEPWYGRCDRVHYTGEFKDRDWMNHLATNNTFYASYTIEIV